MYTLEEYNLLKKKYGGYSSWSIWEDGNLHNTEIIDSSFKELNNNFVILGLNISGLLGSNSWNNFHNNTHSRKLYRACNHTELRGCYITDIFKDYPEPNSLKLKREISEEVINRNIIFFKNEMMDIKLNHESTFVVLGGLTAYYFDTFFKKHFNNKVIYFDHYSAYAKYTDVCWAEEFLKKISG